MEERTRKRVVILGGGFAGVYTARALEQALSRRDDFAITLINRENHFVFQPLLAEVVSGSSGLLDVASPLRRLLPRTDVYVRDIEAIDLRQRTITTSPGFRPHASVLPFDYLVLALGSVTDMVIQGIFPWCFTPELYAARPEYIDSLADFVRGRPMPPVDAFLCQSQAVLGHDAREVLGAIRAPTQLTYGQHDLVTSTRFAAPLTAAIPGADVVVFENCAHAPIYEDVDGFNQRTLAFLRQHAG